MVHVGNGLEIECLIVTTCFEMLHHVDKNMFKAVGPGDLAVLISIIPGRGRNALIPTPNLSGGHTDHDYQS